MKHKFQPQFKKRTLWGLSQSEYGFSQSKPSLHISTSADKAKLTVLPFTFVRELKLWSFHLVVVAQEVSKKLTEKRDARAKFLVCLLILLTFSLPSPSYLCKVLSMFVERIASCRTVVASGGFFYRQPPLVKCSSILAKSQIFSYYLFVPYHSWS